MLVGLSQLRSCRHIGSLAAEGATLWRFGIFRFICDEAEVLSRLLGSFYRAYCSEGRQMG